MIFKTFPCAELSPFVCAHVSLAIRLYFPGANNRKITPATVGPVHLPNCSVAYIRISILNLLNPTRLFASNSTLTTTRPTNHQSLPLPFPFHLPHSNSAPCHHYTHIPYPSPFTYNTPTAPSPSSTHPLTPSVRLLRPI